MKQGRYYMHEQAMDVCLYVEKSYRIGSGRYSVKAATYNLGYAGNPWQLDASRRYEIDDAANWIDVTTRFNNKRTKAGIP